MKRIFIILFSLGLAYGASAQRGYVGHGYAGGGFHGVYHPYYAPRVVYGPGYYGWGWGLGLGYYWGAPGWYGPWMYPYGPYGYGYPPYYYGRGPMPPALQDQIDGIKSDYKAQIKDVKHDKTLSHADRNAKINSLEQQRDAAITEARHDFYKRNNVKPAPGNSSSGNDPDHPEYSGK